MEELEQLEQELQDIKMDLNSVCRRHCTGEEKRQVYDRAKELLKRARGIRDAMGFTNE